MRELIRQVLREALGVPSGSIESGEILYDLILKKLKVLPIDLDEDSTFNMRTNFSISDYKIKKGDSQGKIMSFLTIEDDTCILDSVIVFPEVKEKYKYILYEGNNLILCGSVSNKDTSFIVDKIHEI